MNRLLDWIKEVKEGCYKVIKEDIEKVMKDMEKGNWDRRGFAGLVVEIRDNERDFALLELIEKMVNEEVGGQR
jgi:hypothetical protein